MVDYSILPYDVRKYYTEEYYEQPSTTLWKAQTGLIPYPEYSGVYEQNINRPTIDDCMALLLQKEKQTAELMDYAELTTQKIYSAQEQVTQISEMEKSAQAELTENFNKIYGIAKEQESLIQQSGLSNLGSGLSSGFAGIGDALSGIGANLTTGLAGFGLGIMLLLIVGIIVFVTVK